MVSSPRKRGPGARVSASEIDSSETKAKILPCADAHWLGPRFRWDDTLRCPLSLVLERERHAGAVGDDLAVLNLHVELFDFGHAQVA